MSEDLISSESLALNFDSTGVLIKQARSTWMCKCRLKQELVATIASYATILLVLLWSQKASQNPEVIKSSLLSKHLSKIDLTKKLKK